MTRTLAVVTLTLVLGVALPAAAQPPDWTRRVPMGKRVFITTHSGERIEGIASQITHDGIVVSTAIGKRTIPYRDVRRAQKRDPAWTGAVTGAAAGAAVGIAMVRNLECPGGRQRRQRSVRFDHVVSGFPHDLTSWWVLP